MVTKRRQKCQDPRHKEKWTEGEPQDENKKIVVPSLKKWTEKEQQDDEKKTKEWRATEIWTEGGQQHDEEKIEVRRYLFCLRNLEIVSIQGSHHKEYEFVSGPLTDKWVLHGVQHVLR